MPDPSTLPVELFDLILDYVEDPDEVRTFRHITSVNRYWRMACNPRLYTRYNYDGDKHSIRSLGKYLQRLIHDPDLASQVQTLDIRYWSSEQKMRDHWYHQIPIQDLEILHEIKLRAGLTWSWSQSHYGMLRGGDAGPFLTLLLTILPNVKLFRALLPHKTMHLDLVALHVNRGTFPDRIPSEQCLLRTDALRNVQRVELMSSRGQQSWGSFNDAGYWQHGINLATVAHFMGRKDIQEFTAWDIVPGALPSSLEWTPNSSNITHLTLGFCSEYSVNSNDHWMSIQAMRVLLGLPRQLISLSLHVFEDPFHWEENINEFARDLCQTVYRHRESLQYLDYCCDDRETPRDQVVRVCFGSLHSFSKLQYVRLPVETLLGVAGDGEGLTKHRLHQTLPLNLQTLSLYGTRGLHEVPNLREQLYELLDRPPEHRLSVLGLEGTNKFPHYSRAVRERVLNLFTELRHKCKAQGVRYDTNCRGAAWKRHQICKPLFLRTPVKNTNRTPSFHSAIIERDERLAKFRKISKLLGEQAVEQMNFRDSMFEHLGDGGPLAPKAFNNLQEYYASGLDDDPALMDVMAGFACETLGPIGWDLESELLGFWSMEEFFWKKFDNDPTILEIIREWQ